MLFSPLLMLPLAFQTLKVCICFISLHTLLQCLLSHIKWIVILNNPPLGQDQPYCYSKHQYCKSNYNHQFDIHFQSPLIYSSSSLVLFSSPVIISLPSSSFILNHPPCCVCEKEYINLSISFSII